MDRNDEAENLERLHAHTVPEQYRPFSCTELTNEQIEYAKSHLNETEETKSKYLRRIKRFIERELDVDPDWGDIFLLSYFRARAFDFKRTCTLLRKCKESVEENRHYFDRIDTELMRRIIDSKAVGFLPYRDSKGRPLILIIAENWNPYDLRAEDIIFGSLIVLNTAVENPVNQVSGYVAIVDCKGVYFAQFTEIINWLLFIARQLQHCLPLRVKEIHIVHTPSLVLMGWNIVSPFLDEKVRETIIFYDSENWESLHDKFPPCILPEEIGGHLGPFSNEHWVSDIPLVREKFFHMINKIMN